MDFIIRELLVILFNWFQTRSRYPGVREGEQQECGSSRLWTWQEQSGRLCQEPGQWLFHEGKGWRSRNQGQGPQKEEATKQWKQKMWGEKSREARKEYEQQKDNELTFFRNGEKSYSHNWNLWNDQVKRWLFKVRSILPFIPDVSYRALVLGRPTQEIDLTLCRLMCKKHHVTVTQTVREGGCFSSQPSRGLKTYLCQSPGSVEEVVATESGGSSLAPPKSALQFQPEQLWCHQFHTSFRFYLNEGILC